MKHKGLLVFFIALFFLISISPINALEVSEKGSTYIHFTWNESDYGVNKVSVYVDGMFKTNNSLEYYIIKDVKPSEEHRITLTNTTNQSSVFDSIKTSTFYTIHIYYILMFIVAIFLITTILTKDELTSILFGSICFVLALFATFLSFPYHIQTFSYYTIMIAVIAVIWVLLNSFLLLSSSRENKAYNYGGEW